MGPEVVIGLVVVALLLLFLGASLGGAIGHRLFEVPFVAATWPGFVAGGLTLILWLLDLRLGGPSLEWGWVAFCVGLHLFLQWVAIGRVSRYPFAAAVTLSVSPWVFAAFVFGLFAVVKAVFR